MLFDYPLTKTNRLRLAQAFRHNRRVDISIDCVLEDQMGRAFVDDLERPSAFMLDVSGFCYFAGDANSAGGQEMLAALRPYSLFMPSPQSWAEAAQAMYGERFVAFPRYSFSSARLSREHLTGLLQASPWRERVRRLDDEELVTAVSQSDEGIFDSGAFDSAADFVARGIGYCLLEGDAVPDGVLATVLDLEVMLPCVGQAAIGIEIRADDERLASICQRLNHFNTLQCVTAERAFLHAMGGGCLSPVAAYAEVVGEQIKMRAVSYRDEKVKRGEARRPIKEAVELGAQLAAELH